MPKKKTSKRAPRALEYRLVSPQGTVIVAVLERVQVNAEVNGFRPGKRAGVLVPDYAGESEVDWDSQEPVKAADVLCPGDYYHKQDAVGVCESGSQWSLAKCSLEKLVRKGKQTVWVSCGPPPKGGYQLVNAMRSDS